MVYAGQSSHRLGYPFMLVGPRGGARPKDGKTFRVYDNPEIVVRELFDNRNTKSILNAFDFDRLKWDYRITVGFNEDKIHNAPWGATTIGAILATVERAGYDPLRAAKGNASQKALKKILAIYNKAFHAPKKRREPIRRQLEREVAKKMKNDVVDDIKNATDWVALDPNTVRNRRWKKKAYPSYAKYSSGDEHPMVESGQFAKAVTVKIEELEHTDRMKIALGEKRKSWKHTKEWERKHKYELIGDAPNAVSVKSKGEDDEPYNSDNIVVKRGASQDSIVKRGSPTMIDIMTGRAGRGDLGFEETTFFDDGLPYGD